MNICSRGVAFAQENFLRRAQSLSDNRIYFTFSGLSERLPAGVEPSIHPETAAKVKEVAGAFFWGVSEGMSRAVLWLARWRDITWFRRRTLSRILRSTGATAYSRYNMEAGMTIPHLHYNDCIEFSRLIQ